jgi:hypothetical protein
LASTGFSKPSFTKLGTLIEGGEHISPLAAKPARVS